MSKCINICAGQMRYEALIRAETLADDGAGGSIKTWRDKFTIRCSATQKAGGEKWLQEDLRSPAHVEFTTRYRDDITEADQLVFNGEQYDIYSLDNVEFRNRWLVVKGVRRVAQ